MLNLTAEDCLEPLLKDVLPDDVAMYGARVKLHGLKGRADLNRVVGRCGQYNASKERYEVFLPLHVQVEPILIRPLNLLIAPKVSADILSKEIFSPWYVLYFHVEGEEYAVTGWARHGQDSKCARLG